MVKEVCSPMGRGGRYGSEPKLKPVPPLTSRQIKHAPVYGPLVKDDQTTQLPETAATPSGLTSRRS
jgi:hypothetical protein